MSTEVIEINENNKYYETVEKFSSIYELWKWADENNIDAIPRDKNELEVLEELNLSNLELSDIPDYLSCLKSLKRLSFSRNSLYEFPNCILNLENLEILDLSENNLKEVPADICYLEKLYSIDLDGNYIKNIPDCISDKTNTKYTYWA